MLSNGIKIKIIVLVVFIVAVLAFIIVKYYHGQPVPEQISAIGGMAVDNEEIVRNRTRDMEIAYAMKVRAVQLSHSSISSERNMYKKRYEELMDKLKITKPVTQKQKPSGNKEIVDAATAIGYSAAIMHCYTSPK